MNTRRIHRHLRIEELEPRIAPVGAPGVPDLVSASDTGLLSTDNITRLDNSTLDNRLQFDVSGSSVGYTVALLDGPGGNIIGTAPGNNGTVRITTDGAYDLADGPHSIVAIQYADGDTSGESSGLTITIDTIAPDTPNAPGLHSASDSGISNTDNITNVKTPTLVFSGVGPGDYSRLYRNGVTIGSAYGTSGSYTEPSGLPDGTYTYQLSAVDVAGNASPLSDALSVTIDTTPPPRPDAPDLASYSDSGISNSDNITNVITPDLLLSGFETYYRLFRLGPLLSITITGSAGDYYMDVGQIFTINYTTPALDSSLTIEFYYDTDTDPDNGHTLIVTGIPGNTTPQKYDWNTSNVPPGAYYIYGRICDGVTYGDSWFPGRLVLSAPPPTLTLAFTGTSGYYYSNTGDIFTIGYTASGPSNATIELYYDTDMDATNGHTLIASGIPVKQMPQQYAWNTSSVRPGLYYIYGTLTSDSTVKEAWFPGRLALSVSNATPVATVTTSMGTFTVELAQDVAPITVANFRTYADAGYYNGLIFHRIISTFMIQGGGYLPDYTRRPTNPPIYNENMLNPSNNLSNVTGTIAMARTSDPHSATSEFFINVVDNLFLDYTSDASPGYCVFGHVISGMDVVNAIKSVPVHYNSSGELSEPDDPPVIISVVVTDIPISGGGQASSQPGLLAEAAGGSPVGGSTAGTQISGDYESSPIFTDTTIPKDGTYRYWVVAVDAAGNVSTESFTLTVVIDTHAPTTPSAPSLSAASDSGVSNTDCITNVTRPTLNLSGVAEYYCLYRNGLLISPEYATGSSYTESASLADGVYEYTFCTFDVAGNTSGISTGLTITIDTVPPPVPGAPTLHPDSDTGVFNWDLITSNATPALLLSGITAGDYYRLYVNGLKSGPDYVTAQPVPTANPWPAAPLPKGVSALAIRAVDAAGNISPLSSTLTVLIAQEIPLILGKTCTFTDESGKSVSVTLSGAGAGVFTLTNGETAGAPIGWLILNDTTDKSNLTIKSSKGAVPGTSLDRLWVNSALGTLSAKDVGLATGGWIEANGNIKTVTLGALGAGAVVQVAGTMGNFTIAGASINSRVSAHGIKTVMVGGTIATGTTFTIGAGGIGAMSVKGNADMTLICDGALGALTMTGTASAPVTLRGILDVKTLPSLNGRYANLDRLTLRASEGLGKVAVLGMNNTLFSAGMIGYIQIANDLANCLILAGYDIGANRRYEYGEGDDGPFLASTGNIGAITVGRMMYKSSIAANVKCGPDRKFGTADDIVLSDSLDGAIKSLTVKGTIIGSANTAGEHYGIMAHNTIGPINMAGYKITTLPWSPTGGNITIAAGV